MIFVVEFFLVTAAICRSSNSVRKPPSFGGSDERAEHEVSDRLLAEAIGNDFQLPPVFDEQPFQEIVVLRRRTT